MVRFVLASVRVVLPAAAVFISACAQQTSVGTDASLSIAQRDAIQIAASRPEIAPDRALRATTVVYTVRAPLDAMVRWHISVPLEEIMEPSGNIPDVVGTVPLIGVWGEAGARRRILLEDGDTALEDLLVSDLPRSFRYMAWNYTSDATRFVDYGVGEFSMRAIGANTTEVTWTYAFKPRGILGRLFVGRFVNTTWRAWMEQTAAAMTARAEADLASSR